ncbi:Uncharacterised protein [Leclercia adecarboxylata]|uniref:Uncharacterized protein n=1 Tax=Leclercia adecarboxylata TaxID=83655 RepID=A0A4U9HMG7_9ENTR|nr:Uncharacterised protein [Leclercia adecarboxylata]
MADTDATHHYVTAFKQRLGRGQTHLLDMFVHRGIFFDKGIGARDVGFRLIVVVVRDEILHRIFGEELFHLAVQLRSQRFIWCQHHGRPLQIGDHVGDP